MRLSNKVSDWNTGLIAVGAILFVVGLGLAVVLVVLLVMRIKASCMLLVIRLKCAHHHILSTSLSAGSVSWWYWVLLTVSAVLSLTSLALWIALGVYVSMNGESYHDSTTPEMMCMINSMSFCKLFQTLLKERTQGSGVRTSHSVKLLLQTVSRMDWSLPAFCLLY